MKHKYNDTEPDNTYTGNMFTEEVETWIGIIFCVVIGVVVAYIDPTTYKHEVRCDKVINETSQKNGT